MPSSLVLPFYTLWDLARSLPPLDILSLLYGLFSSGYVVL